MVSRRTALVAVLLSASATAATAQVSRCPDPAGAARSAATVAPARTVAPVRVTARTATTETEEARRNEIVLELEKAQQELEVALKELDREDVPPGAKQARKSALDAAKSQLMGLQQDLKDRRFLYKFNPGSMAYAFSLRESMSPETRRQREELFGRLERPMDVELRDATVRQAAKAISEAAGIVINVDRDVTHEKRLTVIARSTPIWQVLEQVARPAGLIIAPDGNGVLLKPSPSLQVGDRKTVVVEPFAPWSRDWGTIPLTSKAHALNIRPFAATRVQIPDYPMPMPGFGTWAGGAAPSPVSMTALGSDQFVIANPAPPGEEPGVVLTVYRLEGTQLRVVTTTFHRFGRPPTAAVDARNLLKPVEPEKPPKD